MVRIEIGMPRVLDAARSAELASAFGMRHAFVVDACGDIRVTPLDERMIVTPADILTSIPVVLAVAYDKAKAPAVWAALKKGTVNALVTHASLARAVLAYSPIEGPEPGAGARMSGELVRE